MSRSFHSCAQLPKTYATSQKYKSLMSVSRHEHKRLFWSSVSGFDIKEQVCATVKESSYYFFFTILFFFHHIVFKAIQSLFEVIFICEIKKEKFLRM